ncbi:hypothetical protein EUTSA_v10014260mg [Eutrema salsugineum]|uniref:Uncharacterized protein n=1 Tax=Eutrema salsugineum TaxID=72664 RepID=V4N4K0_EUTSA|nr:uncharacterized protein LOC18016791 [Eutrema salsugineum]ESQ40311.1 hypothetical protein EUTSA_v10014260mg [Eutrema salsugineum]
MSNWRRQKPRNNNNYNHHHQRDTTMTQSSKPPLANYKLSVPAWEKEFCAVVGSVPWRRVLEAKRFMHLYDGVAQWDDSAGEEAFKNAKSRYWAEINGAPCDLSLPDPDVYIDDVDWESEVDAELILDLERGPNPIAGEEEEHVVILDALFLSEQYSGLGWGTGWGDAEGINEENVNTGKPENSWGDQNCNGWVEDSWEIKERTGSWSHKNNSFKTESWDHKNSKSNNSFNRKNSESWNCKDQGRENREWRKRGDLPRGGVQVKDCGWRNGRGRSRGGFQKHSNGWGWTESF